jgi:membrane-bound ClpP family serine protease
VGARSYHDFALGLALLLIAAAIVVAAALPRPIAYLMGLSGLTYLVQGWVVGSEGFSETHTVLILVAWVLTLAWMIWLAVVAWRMPDWDASRTS